VVSVRNPVGVAGRATLRDGSASSGVMAAESDDVVIGRSVEMPVAFGAIFDRHSRSVYRYLRRRVGADLAADLTAETFARAFSARDRYEQRGESALPWLLGIATNLIKMHRRGEERRLRAFASAAVAEPVVMLVDQATGTGALDDRLDAAALAPALGEALAALPARQRDVLLLHTWAELSLAEIAIALDLPAATVRSHIHRARRFIESRLPQHADPRPEPTR
jgi:RNA polymerase sigma factor (sigma-70 family)